MMNFEDLKEGHYYTFEYPVIGKSKIGTCTVKIEDLSYKDIRGYCVFFTNVLFYYRGRWGTFNEGMNWREATFDEIAHLNQCIEAGKYVEYTITESKQIENYDDY